MTGKELSCRREALKLTQYDLAEEFGCTEKEIEDWEAGRSPYGENLPRLVDLAIDQLDYIETRVSDEEIDATLAAAAAAVARSEAVITGRHKIPPAPDQALIAAAQRAAETMQIAITNAASQGLLPRTVEHLKVSKQRLERAIEVALGISE
jgi:transcriptional regulator with XRE-family HTH domain